MVNRKKTAHENNESLDDADSELFHTDVTVDETEDTLPASDATLAERILWLTDRVGYLKKDSTVTVGRGYAAITHDKVTAYLRPKLVQAGILMFPTCIKVSDHDTGATTSGGTKIVQHRAEFLIQFENAHDKEDTRSMCVFAYADDYGDKAPGKALSYATKYAMLKMFKIETGEDDESRVDESGEQRRAGVLEDDDDMCRLVWELADECWGADAHERLRDMAKRRFFVERYELIPQNRYDDAMRSIRVAADRDRQADS